MDARAHGSELDGIEMIRIPLKGMPKKRPRVGDTNTYMPAAYTDWKKNIAVELMTQGLLKGDPIEGNLRIIARFGADFIDVQLVRCDEVRPKGLTADSDNLIGGLMDALADANLIVNDRQIIGIEVAVWEVDQQ